MACGDRAEGFHQLPLSCKHAKPLCFPNVFAYRRYFSTFPSKVNGCFRIFPDFLGGVIEKRSIHLRIQRSDHLLGRRGQLGKPASRQGNQLHFQAMRAPLNSAIQDTVPGLQGGAQLPQVAIRLRPTGDNVHQQRRILPADLGLTDPTIPLFESLATASRALAPAPDEPILVVFNGSAEQIHAGSRTRITGLIMDLMLIENVSQAIEGRQ